MRAPYAPGVHVDGGARPYAPAMFGQGSDFAANAGGGLWGATMATTDAIRAQEIR